MCVIAEDKRLMEDHKREVDTLQRKVSELQADYKQELKKAKDLIEVRNISDNNSNNVAVVLMHFLFLVLFLVV